jgi:hypothetical protein
MATPRNRIVAFTVSVWLAASGSAAALTYELGRASVGQSAPALSARAAASVESPALERAESIESSLVYLPSARIVATPRPRLNAVARGAPQAVARDISAMICADWRDLDMGSGHVQVCQ